MLDRDSSGKISKDEIKKALKLDDVDDVTLEKKACFPSKQFLFFNEYAYQFDNEGDIHEFDVKDCKFKLVNISKQ